MKIQSIKGTNFKSFGPEGVSFSFKDGMNTIVGENNVGKSNLIRMMDIVKSSLSENKKR
jgi:chromosome segregation ATPase